MRSHVDIKTLALEKFADAQCLFENKRYDAAYYLAGYAAELLIKAKICKSLGIDNFFDFGNRKKFKNEDQITRPYKVHDLEQLITLSGALVQFEEQFESDENFGAAWSTIINWDENSRYETGKTEIDVKKLLTSIIIFQKWILGYL